MFDIIIKVLASSKKIAILPHVSADGDSLGSSFALAMALTILNKQVSVLIEEEIPQTLSFLPGKQFASLYKFGETNFDTVIAIDSGDLGRLGKRVDVFESAMVTINIDHHSTNTEFAVHNHVDTKASSVGEIIYNLLNELGTKLDKDMSTCLYVAIVSDTGGFRYSNTTSATHTIASQLIKNDVDVAGISQNIFDSTSYQKVRLLGAAIDALELTENGKIAIISLTADTISKSGANDEDCEGIVNIGRNIRGVKVAAMLRQLVNGEIKVNLRSSSEVDVAAIASLYSGGGHKKAAGFTTNGSLDDVKKRLLEDIKEVI